MEIAITNLRENGIPSLHKWYNDSRKQVIQSFAGTSALSLGILRRLKGKETTHFNADASNTELLFRIIHSANQLSVYGTVSDWSGQFDLRSNEKESTSQRSTAKEDSVNKEILKSVS